jgi:hypothetical protein
VATSRMGVQSPGRPIPRSTRSTLAHPAFRPASGQLVGPPDIAASSRARPGRPPRPGLGDSERRRLGRRRSHLLRLR